MNDDECIVCYEKQNAINYTHKCGKYKIHESCLYNWLSLHNDQCITCREELNTHDFVLTDDNGKEIKFDLPKEIILSIQDELPSNTQSTTINSFNESICEHKWKLTTTMLLLFLIIFIIFMNYFR